MAHRTEVQKGEKRTLSGVRRKRTPTWVDEVIAIEGIIVMPLEMAHSQYEIHRLAELVEGLASNTAAALGNITEELTDMRALVIQNRLALDTILAKEGGVGGVIHQEGCVYTPDNSGNIRKEIEEIKKVEEGAGKVADGTDVGGMLDRKAAWFMGWGTWLVEVLAIGIMALITICVLIPVCPSFLALLLKKKKNCHQKHTHYRRKRYKDDNRDE
ncbi:hypothetical protein NDU88_005381 [Pleurodeles waltl]|uniref:Uncharacterized protein n=1 Tax=Pleurodeles waltl TaxID=8319 RepID=A0AAV7WY45_PLEWA|nr:hypothetical protein NDU88_005381 [Pleurodeles waltl]